MRRLSIIDYELCSQEIRSSQKERVKVLNFEPAKYLKNTIGHIIWQLQHTSVYQHKCCSLSTYHRRLERRHNLCRWAVYTCEQQEGTCHHQLALHKDILIKMLRSTQKLEWHGTGLSFPFSQVKQKTLIQSHVVYQKTRRDYTNLGTTLNTPNAHHWLN